MSRTSKTTTALAAGFLALALGHPVAAEDVEKYDIILTRAAHVGQKLHVSAEGSQEIDSEPRINGQRQRGEHRLIHVVLEADAEVLAVDENAQPIRMAYTILKCEHTIDGKTAPIGAKGAKIIAERRADGDTHYTLNGRPVGVEESTSLRILTRFDDKGFTHQELAGDPSPKTPGESWPIDAEATRDAIERTSGQRASADKINGKVTFWEPTERSGVPCLLVDTEFEINDWLAEKTPGFDLTSAAFKATIRGLYPVDETRPVMAESERMSVNAVLSGSPFGGQHTMEITLKVIHRVEREVTPIEASIVVVE